MRAVAWMVAVAVMGGAMVRAEEPAATATAPATAPSLSERLFGDRETPPTAATLPSTSTAPSTQTAAQTPAGTETAQPVGNIEPKVKGIDEGTIIRRRVVRLMVEKQTGQYLVVFDGDGKLMSDPPMVAMPSSSLQDMEKITENGKRAFRFQITGEVTQYRGRNYILIRTAVQMKDMNSGISGG